MVTVAWVSRHVFRPAELTALQRMGMTKLVHINKTFTDVEDVLAEIRKAGADAAVLVLPLSMIKKLVEMDDSIIWLWSEMELVHRRCPGTPSKPWLCPQFRADTDVVMAKGGENKHLRFKGFYRIKAVKIELEPIKTLKQRRK